jgi:hypothetical protein
MLSASPRISCRARGRSSPWAAGLLVGGGPYGDADALLELGNIQLKLSSSN